jgi:DNA-binding ferritin-like protein
MKRKEESDFQDLEARLLEKAEITTHLNKVLAAYHLYTHKMRNFYWTVEGQDSFDLRGNFKKLYTHGFSHMDEIADRISFFNHIPVRMLNDLVRISEIKENRDQLTSFEMVKSAVRDITILISLLSACIEKARELGDHGTEAMMKMLIKELEMDYILFKSWLK